MAAPIGNQNAAKSKIVHDALRKLCVQEDHRRVQQGLDAVLNAFAAGEAWAVQFVRDTLDGKPAQTVSSDPENPFTLVAKIERAILDPKDSNS